MGTPSAQGQTPAPSALVRRHLEDLFGSESVPRAALERLQREGQCIGTLPRLNELTPEGNQLATVFRTLSPELRARLLAMAVQGEMSALSFQRAAAAATGFIDIAERGRTSWTSDTHRMAVLAAAEADDHRLAASVHLLDHSKPHGAALHLLFADETVDTADLVRAADFFACSDRPSWALHCLVSAAETADTPATAATLAAAAANIAAFDGDFGIAERVLERFTTTDTRVLIRNSAPARALRQALVESDTTAARATILARLRSKGLDSSTTGEALAVYALINMLAAEMHEWEAFGQACLTAPAPLHPEIAAIADTMNALNAPSEGHLERSAAADGRGWSQLAGCVATILYAFRDMRMVTFAPPSNLAKRVGNRLSRTIEAVYVSVMLAHNQYWNELDETLTIAIRSTTETIPIPVMRVSSEAILAFTKAFRGDREAARRIISEVMTERVLRLTPLRALVDSVSVLVEGPKGNYEYAVALLSTRRFNIFHLITGPCGPVELFDFVDYALMLQQEDVAIARVEHFREGLQSARSARADFVLAACDAAIATRRTLAPAEDLLERSESLPFVYEAARLRLVYAERLRTLGRTPEARRHLLRVEFDLASVQAGAWMDRVQRELRACQKEIVVSAADLTEKEMQIAQLAADGLSNKEIGTQLYLSPRTVSGHLYKIFPKLGITTRVQLRDALAVSAEAEGGHALSE